MYIYIYIYIYIYVCVCVCVCVFGCLYLCLCVTEEDLNESLPEVRFLEHNCVSQYHNIFSRVS